MKLFKRSRTLNTGSPFLFIGNGKTLQPNTVNADSALRNSDVFSVIFRVSSDIASATFKSPNDAVLQVLNNPTPLINSYSFFQSSIAQMMLTGNSYILIHRTKGNITGLESIPFDWVQIELNDNSTATTYTVNFDDNRGTKVFPSTDIIHLRCFVSGQSATQFVGTSPLDSLSEEIGIQNYSNKLASSALQHAIMPSFVINVPQGALDAEAKNNIRDQFEQANGGDNAGRAMVLDQSATVNTLQLNPDTANLISSVNFSQTQIAKAFVLPLNYLNGQGDQQSSATDLQDFYANSLTAYISPLLSELSMKLGAPIHIDTSDITDLNHQQLISNIRDLATGKTPIITPMQAQQILINRGAFPELIPTPVAQPPQTGGDYQNNEQD